MTTPDFQNDAADQTSASTARHLAEPTSRRRARSAVARLRRRGPAGMTAGVAVVLLTTTATAAFSPQQSPESATTQLAAAQAGTTTDPAHVEVAAQLVDDAAAEVSRAAYVADSEEIDAETRTEIVDARARVDALVDEVAQDVPALAPTDLDPVATSSGTAEAVAAATPETSSDASRDAGAVSDEAVESDETDADETVDDPTGADTAVDDPTVDDAAVDDAAVAEVAASVPAAQELADATTELSSVLDDAASGTTAVVEAGPTPEEVAAQEAAEEKAAAEAAAEAEAARVAELTAQAKAYGNGEIPSNLLCDVSFDSSVLVRCDAAAALEDLDAAYAAQFGKHLSINSSYRSYAAQVSTKAAKGYLAATPGTSNHGNAIAVDLSIGGYGSAEYTWLLANAPTYGWDNPSWARQGGSKAEPWHWEFGTND